MSRRVRAYLGLLIILIVFVSLTVATSFRAPLDVGPDEVAHFMFARFLRQEMYLPVTPEDRRAAGYKSDQPPLNAALVALASAGVDVDSPPFLKLSHDVPRRHLVVGKDGITAWRVLDTEDPIAGEHLLWRIGRLLSVVFSAATLVVVYHIALVIFEGSAAKYLWALVVVFVLATIPTFVFVSSVLSYENLLGLWLALYLLMAVYIVKWTEPGWLYIAAGLFVGLAIVTKLSALLAPVSLIMVVLIAGYRAAWPARKHIGRLALGLLGVLLGAGWWFALIIAQLNRVDELGWLAGLIYPILVADGSDITSVEIAYLFSGGTVGSIVETADRLHLSDWLERVFRTLWRLQWQGQNSIFLALGLVTALSLIGLIRTWWKQPNNRLWINVLVLNAAVFFILPVVRLYFTEQTNTGQGQHILFPAAGSLAILMVWGLSGWFPTRGRWQLTGGVLLGAGLLVWSIVQSVQIYQPPLPVRTSTPALPDSAAAIQAPDIEPITLVGYDLHGVSDVGDCCDPAYHAVGVDLYWNTTEFAVEDYLTEVSLVDSKGEAQSIWLGHPANGRYPTRAWEPGDTIRDETWLPLNGLPGGTYTVTLRLLGSQGQPASDAVVLTQLEIAKPAGRSVDSNRTDRPLAFDIWQRGQLSGQMPTFESRSTIQITTGEDSVLKLVGPDRQARTPVAVAGRTHNFVVDPTWPKGEYRLSVERSSPATLETEPVLFARGEGRNLEAPASQIVVNANFANQLALLGYNLPRRHLSPGDRLPLTLNWQALRQMPGDFIMFTRLRDLNGQVWGGYDRKPREVYTTLLWVAGEVVEDGFTIEIDENAPAGLYYVDVGFYLPVGEAAVSLPLVQNGQMSDATSVLVGPFKVGQLPVELARDSVSPRNDLELQFGEGPHLNLIGYELIRDETGRGANLTLYWEAIATLALDYTTFVHVRNAAGETVAQKDQPPLGGAYPTSLWEPGEIIVDELFIPWPAELNAGEYQFVVGMYDPRTGQRLSVPGSPADEAELTSVEIP